MTLKESLLSDLLALPDDWKPVLSPHLSPTYWDHLATFLSQEISSGYTIYPKPKDWYQALKQTPYHQVKVVILGQDPYHGPNQAHGLSFSVTSGSLPPSLRNIYKELHDDMGCFIPQQGNLSSWAKQGVLLWNSVLTVREKQAASHQGKGWEALTYQVIRAVNNLPHPVVFILWGKSAQEKARWIDAKRHLILQSPHPSPLSAYRGFFGSRPFSKANDFLIKTHQQPIQWCSVSQKS